jgi:DNA-binding MarR family transcriptional regulator
MPIKEKTIDQWIRETWMSIAKYYNDVASDYGGTMAIGFTLLNIDPREGTPSTLLPKKMGMEMTSLSRTLKKMEDKGLIYREKNPSDGRSVLIKLTDYGHQMREASKTAVLSLNDRIKERLTPEKLACFTETLQLILELTQRKTLKNQHK